MLTKKIFVHFEFVKLILCRQKIRLNFCLKSQNVDGEQKLLFARLIFNAKEILFADSANSEVTKPEKASKWFEILMQLNSVGANIPDYKTIRDQEWSNMRRAVEKKLASVKANEGKPQEEQVPIRPFTQTEEIVLDILGKGSGTTQKTEVDLSDFPVQGTVRVMESMTSGNFGGVKFEEDDDDDDDGGFVGGENASESNNTAVGVQIQSTEMEPIIPVVYLFLLV